LAISRYLLQLQVVYKQFIHDICSKFTLLLVHLILHISPHHIVCVLSNLIKRLLYCIVLYCTVPIFALTVYHPSSRLDLNLICFTNPLLHSKFLATFWSALTDLGLGSDLHLLATCVFGANRKRIMQLPIVTLDISYFFSRYWRLKLENGLFSRPYFVWGLRWETS